jgi:hypothetical protein
VTAVYALDSTPRDAAPEHDREALEQHIRGLQERLAFYEGFDLLIQDNVAQARELFRLASMEREAATSATERARRESNQREAALRGELEAIAAELTELEHAVNALSRRVALALGESSNGWVAPAKVREAHPMAVVVHGVPSARTALSLQRYVASLPQVADVSAREFAGGVLRLDARVRERLLADQFAGWDDPRRMLPLTERPDVIELELQSPDVAASRAGA